MLTLVNMCFVDLAVGSLTPGRCLGFLVYFLRALENLLGSVNSVRAFGRVLYMYARDLRDDCANLFIVRFLGLAASFLWDAILRLLLFNFIIEASSSGTLLFMAFKKLRTIFLDRGHKKNKLFFIYH